ncbi:hypothetical protein [Sphingomonas sp. AX6]|uniref:hypothetical protein n=1 Tax=Sphingomonas sp. AX6 TaxID=2653171 RepID=UPI0012F2D9E8|nr:hypothetical protein [Sphingomonas sp. AX6]VXC96737.1 conserved exported hypothetical protein [Sphingomonas sp. AX6]
MKTLLRASLAAAALMASVGTAQAQNGTTTSVTDFGTFLQFGLGTFVNQTTVSLFGDTQTASPTVTKTFALTGNVNKDCSYYIGNGDLANRNISLGTIGIRTNAGETVTNAFDMVGPAGAVITSGTAGCNFNNTVTITKANGTDGLENQVASGYDTNQFQANLPYTVNANWTGVQGAGTIGAGTGQSLTVGLNEATDQWTGGAWRSGFVLTFGVPVASLGLVAGTYTDTVTVELKAL